MTKTVLSRIALALFASLLAATGSGAAQAQAVGTKALVVPNCGLQVFQPTINGQQNYAPLTILPSGILCTLGGYSGAAATTSGSGTSATADPVQGVSGGYPVAISGTTTANQGAAGSAPWLTTIYQGGAALSATNPIFDQVTNFPNGFNALQGGQPNSATNQFFEQTVGPSMQAPGTASTIARAVQRPDGKNILTASDLPASYPDATADAALGNPGDAAAASGGNGSVIAQLKALLAKGTQDPQNAPYGLSGASQGATLTPGNSTATTAGRNIHIFCAPTTSPATGYTTLTEANGETHQVQLASGAQYDFPWAVTLVAAQTTVTGTLAACEFKNMN